MRRQPFAIALASVFLVCGVCAGRASAQAPDAQNRVDAAPVFGQFLRQIDGVWPEAVAVGDDGRILVVDALQRRLRVFDGNGVEVETQTNDVARYNSQSTIAVSLHPRRGDLLPSKPIDVSIDGDRRKYVVDANNHRVIGLNESEQQRWSLGGFGTNPGQFADPTAIAWVPNSNTLLVADSQNHRIQAISTDGEFLYEWGKHALVPREGNGKIHYPNDVTVAPDGSFVVVAELFERRIQIFGPRKGDAPSTELPALTQPDVQSHFGKVMAVDGRLCAVWEPELRRVLVFDMGGPVPIHITTFGSYGTKLGQFTKITGMAIDESTRTIFILDDATRRVDVVELNFDPDAPPKSDPTMAKFVRSIPIEEFLDANSSVVGLRKVGTRDLALIDAGAMNLRIIDIGDGISSIWPVVGSERRESRPLALTVDEPRDRIIVVDDLSRTVLARRREDRHSAVLSKAGESGETLILPVDVCTDSAGNLYVIDAGLDAVIKYNAAGDFIRRFGSTGTDDGELWMPSAVGIDCQNRVVVLDYGNHRGQLFTTEGEWLASFSAGRARTRKLTQPPPQPQPQPPPD